MAETDNATRDLIRTVQLQDLRNLREQGLGGGSNSCPHDLALAAALYEDALLEEANANTNRRLSHQYQSRPSSPTPSTTLLSDEAHSNYGSALEEWPSSLHVNY